jgi:putative membrane protein
MRVRVVIAPVLMVPAAVAAAHERVGASADPRVLSEWDTATLIGLAALALLYCAGARRLHRRGAHQSPIAQAAFAAGWLALVFAVLPWMDSAALERFSAHMAQHELMMLVGAPLVVAGRPLSTCLWGLPDRWRRRVTPGRGLKVATSAVSTLSTPALAWALHGAAVWIWHLPALYDLAVRSEPAHAVQHATFVGTSLLFWTGLLYGRYGRAGYGVAVFFVFTTAVHTGILGALFTVSQSPLYSAYANVPGADRDSVLADQQLAGLVMWIPAGLLLTLVGLALFAAWLGEAERKSRLGQGFLSDRSAAR